MIGENWQLVINEPVEVQDCRRITDHFKGIYRVIYPTLIHENWRMSICNQLDLQRLGSQPVMPKNLPDHCFIAAYSSTNFFNLRELYYKIYKYMSCGVLEHPNDSVRSAGLIAKGGRR
jgi:hypothetical protein